MKTSPTASSPAPLSRLRTWLAPLVAPVANEATSLRVGGARKLLGDAYDLDARGEEHAALVLYREAFKELAAVRRLAGLAGTKSGASDAELVSSMFEKSGDVEALLTTTSASSLEPKRLAELLVACKRAAARFESFLSSELGWTKGNLRFARLALFLGAMTLFAVEGARCVLAPKNLALGRPVTSTSVWVGTPTGLTNGAIEWGGFGLHSGGGASATIDLSEVYTLSDATIYARGDGHFERGVPLRIEASEDGKSYRNVGSCDQQFTQAVPCEAQLGGKRGRYVRLSASPVTLAEVEIHGAR